MSLNVSCDLMKLSASWKLCFFKGRQVKEKDYYSVNVLEYVHGIKKNLEYNFDKQKNNHNSDYM